MAASYASSSSGTFVNYSINTINTTGTNISWTPSYYYYPNDAVTYTVPISWTFTFPPSPTPIKKEKEFTLNGKVYKEKELEKLDSYFLNMYLNE